MTYPNINHLLAKYRLVLASGSPRRIDILTKDGIPFRQIVPDINEDNNSIMDPVELATHLAEEKAFAVSHMLSRDEIALGCDTIVILNKKILGKPDSPAQAIEMLTSLSGNMHIVCSAIALLKYDGRMVSGAELTDVYFKKLSSDQIEKYVASGEPLDKAGAYGIQELGAFLVDRIIGNIDNVTGLPMTLLERLSAEIAG